MKLSRARHRDIWSILEQFDDRYLENNTILFGGGTRIAMELSEYRESIDIDFLCADATSFKAVRTQITSNSLGSLLKDSAQIAFLRDIRADRDAVRAFVVSGGQPVKLEFIHFDNYALVQDERNIFPVPCINKQSCFLTKLLANADRYSGNAKKDIFDLIMMFACWGKIPSSTWALADEKYGLKVVYHGLNRALWELENDKPRYKALAGEVLLLEPQTIEELFEHSLPSFRAYVDAESFAVKPAD